MELTKELNFEEGLEMNDGLEMFNLLCVANDESCELRVTFGLMKNEAHLELMKALGKEKEYQNYLIAVSETIEPVFGKLNEITTKFIKNELLKNPVFNREELDVLISKLLARAILGGRR